jgi:hypothetical protein
MLIETSERSDERLAFCRVVRAVKFELNIGDAFDEEGRAALVGTDINL